MTKARPIKEYNELRNRLGKLTDELLSDDSIDDSYKSELDKLVSRLPENPCTIVPTNIGSPGEEDPKNVPGETTIDDFKSWFHYHNVEIKNDPTYIFKMLQGEFDDKDRKGIKDFIKKYIKEEINGTKTTEHGHEINVNIDLDLYEDGHKGITNDNSNDVNVDVDNASEGGNATQDNDQDTIFQIPPASDPESDDDHGKVTNLPIPIEEDESEIPTGGSPNEKLLGELAILQRTLKEEREEKKQILEQYQDTAKVLGYFTSLVVPELEGALNDREDELGATNDELSKAREEMDELNTELDQAYETLEEKERTIKDKNNELSGVHTQLERLQDRTEEASEKVKEAKERKEEADEKLGW